MSGTEHQDYATRLAELSSTPWKRLLNVQAPYRRNVARQGLGRTLDIGCGIGRNLGDLSDGSVGVDHNERCVEVARAQGLAAVTPTEWTESEFNQPASFDGMLLAHVVEHMTSAQARDLVMTYLPAIRPGGRVFFICPQERGFRSDPTHVQFTTGPDLESLARSCGLVPEPWRSFPFPRFMGRAFTYNEFTVLAHKPTAI